MFRISLAVLASLASGFLPGEAIAKEAAPAARVYEGSVGSSPIVLSLERSEDSVSGNYFYRARRFDIDLGGDVKKGVIHLESGVTGDKLSLKPDGSGYAGSLTTAKGKTLPVQLRAVGPEAAVDVPADAGEGIDLYEKMRLSGLTLKPQKLETVAGRNLRWYVEPTTGARLFRVESGYAAPVMETMNKALAQIQWANVSEYFGCPSSDGGSGLENVSVDKPYLSDAYVSFAIEESWSCAGAAHPDAGMEAHSFDARTGKEIELDDLLKFGKGPVPQKDSDAWLDYRSKTFAPALVTLLKRLYPKEMKAPRSDDDCNYSDAEVWSFPAWRLTEKGLYVGASFARAMRVCDNPEWSIIPYAALNESARRR
ncbi:hypothetical protein ACNHKD_19145 [Methylocystis sp. JAN1]|uniref:hypothetical protein n=1 Tax=Methylocystis sp. JAN1 TaxID=3397211 RepID=UPI003FA2E2CE